MYIILKSTLNGKHDHYASDTTAASLDPSPSDPWLFTDPSARDLYKSRNLMDQLEEDIQTYVMFDGGWALEELEYKHELRRLLREGIIAPKGGFGYLSPHPTVYRTLKAGTLMISGQRCVLETGEDLMFEPWLARYSDPGLKGPLRVGQLYHGANPLLCSDAFPHIYIQCDKTRAIMRQILNYRNNK